MLDLLVAQLVVPLALVLELEERPVLVLRVPTVLSPRRPRTSGTTLAPIWVSRRKASTGLL